MKGNFIIGLRVNYGLQQFYRDNGIEPCCGMCIHFQSTPDPDGLRICLKNAKQCRDGDVCYSPERAPGVD